MRSAAWVAVAGLMLFMAAPAAAQRDGAGTAPYDVSQLSSAVRSAAERARSSAAEARAVAARARSAGQEGERSGRQSPREGYGVMRWTNGDFAGYSFYGTFSSGRFVLGVLHYASTAIAADSLRTEGDFDRNIGACYYRDGGVYCGPFPDDRKSGYGVMEYSSGARYEGGWENDVRHGYGVEWDSSGRVIRAGRWSGGQYAGAS